MIPYYEQDGITIYHGDCREVDAWREMEFLVTDPPYGIGHVSSSRGNAEWRGRTAIVGDGDTTLRDWMIGLWGDRPALVFGSWKVLRPAFTKMVLTWDKGMSCGMGDLGIPWKPNTEEIYVMGSGFRGHRGSSVLSYGIVGQVSWGRTHPNEKPVTLMRDLLAKCPGSISDPFMGTGATLRAAKDLGRHAVGIEIEERYCEIAVKRLAQGSLFT